MSYFAGGPMKDADSFIVAFLTGLAVLAVAAVFLIPHP
jgi:hypothetical protein